MHTLTTASDRRNGFTLIEIIVTVVVLAILVSIAVVSYTVQQRETRDSQRDARVLAISEALEKYYDENGEYPSCSSLSGTANEVSTDVLVGIDQSTLTTPSDKSGSTNSISCSDLTDIAQGDYYAYVGDGSLNCQSGNACLTFTLKYIDEADGTIKTVVSRNMTDIATSGTSVLTVAATGFTTVNADWTAVPNATSYTLQRATDSNFTQNLAETTHSGTSAGVSGLSMNTTYYFRVRATASGSIGNWSTGKSAVTWNLLAPTVNRTSTLTTITGTWTAAAHATTYSTQYSTDNSTWVTVCSASASTTCTRSSLAPGTTYYLRTRSENGSFNSAWSAGASIATQALGVPAVTRGTETTTTVAYSWSAVANATGYQYQYRINDGAWVGPTATGSTSVTITSSNGAKVDVQVRSTLNGGYSSWSSLSTGYLIPATPTVNYGSVTTSSITFSWAAVTNANGYHYQYRYNGGAWSTLAWTSATSINVTSGTQGTNVEIQVRSLNYDNNYGAWYGPIGTTLSVSGPAWNAWGHTYSYPSIVTWVYNTGGSSLCPAGTVVYARYAGGVGAVGAFGAYSANGSSSETTRWTETVSGYSNVLYSQIQGYCRNETTGAQSVLVGTGVDTTTTPAPPGAVLSGASYCVGAYSGRPAYQVALEFQETSYNLDANTSVVTWWAFRKAAPGNTKTFNETLNAGNSYNVVVDGVSVASGTSASGRWRYNTASDGQIEALYSRSSAPNTNKISGARTVAHNANGTKTITVSVSDVLNPVPFGTASCSASYTLSDLR